MSGVAEPGGGAAGEPPAGTEGTCGGGLVVLGAFDRAPGCSTVADEAVGHLASGLEDPGPHFSPPAAV